MVTDAPRKTGDIGGAPKQNYYTPDGRIIRAMPDMHGYGNQRDKEGNIIESGVRDANLDKGWLAQMPSELKPYCPHCDRWHDTEDEIAKCEQVRKKWVTNLTKKAQKELGGDRIDKLETEISEIKNLLTKLLEK